jgi:CRISPR system Cascade subunit CasB
MKPCDFRDEEVRGKVLSWWESLQEDRGSRAELSRVTRQDDIFGCAGFYTLRHSLKDRKVYDPALARVAAVLSRIRRDRDGESFGMLAGRCVHESRVKRMLRKSGDRLTADFCVLVKIMKSEAPVAQAAEIVYWWEVRHPNRDFLYDFYSKKEEIAHA